MKVNVPPIKIQGIKTKLVPLIKDVIQWDFSGKWIEPFMGSGVVGFNIRPKKAVFSDTNPHIINFYNEIKSGEITSTFVRQFLENEGAKLAKMGADYYYEVRERFNEKGNPMDFLFLNRSCFNGMIRFNGSGKFNVPFGHKPNRFAPAYVTKIVNQISYVEDALQLNDWGFVCQNFEDAIAVAKGKDFIYCDPPYIGRHTDYYNSWQDENEKRLYQLLSNSDAKFILSTWHSNQHRENAYIDSLWSDFYMVTKEHFYHVGAKEKNRKPMLEALIMNYEPVLKIEKRAPEQIRMFERRAKYSTD